MKILLIKNNRLYSYILPKEVKDNYWITDIDSFDNVRNLINVEAINGEWVLVSNYDTHIVDATTMYEKFALAEYHFYSIKNDSEKSIYYLYAIPDIEKTYVSYNVSESAILNIGKSSECDIIYNNVLVSDFHAKLEYGNNSWVVYDNKSKMGVYVNDKKIDQSVALQYGDVVFIAGLKIIIMKGFIVINNVLDNVKINTNCLRLREKPNIVIDNTKEKDEDLNRSLYAKEEYFYRSPRFIEDIVKETVNFDNPPAKMQEEEQSLILTIGPMFTMALTSFATAFGTISNITNGTTSIKQSLPSLIMAGSMFLSMLFWPIITRIIEKRRRKKKEAERIKKYEEYLDKKREDIDSIIDNQSTILKDKYIPLEECANIILRKKANLWQRSISQKDFLALRLGIGDMPIYADINYSKQDFTLEDDELRQKIEKIVEDRKMLTDVPIVFSLVEKYITSIIGTNALIHDFFKGQLLQLITYHSYEFLKIVVFTDKEHTSSFDYFHNLPYLFDDLHQTRFFANDLDETKEISLYLERIYQDRKANKVNFVDSPPYYIIITDNYHMYRDVEIIKDILSDGENYGFSLLIFSEKLQNLPSECKNFINVYKERSGIFESEISAGNQREFKTEFCEASNVDIDECIKKISNIPIEFNNDDKALPNTISFMEMYNAGKVEQLNILQRYQSNNSQKSLAVPVGVEKSGSLLKLDLHEKYHGPHGLIAGMTGSGKSEFIITYILSMATNFSPLDVAFILIDYKGGGLAGAFENRETGISLPHLAGTITNLDVSEMNRSLSSIQSELRRRQQIFNEARDKLGESTVDIYKYQKFFKEGKVEEAIPHLFIICDEFAELKSQQPDFMDQLISTARIGRSLGVHLILATQKPSGVVNDQIWSNSRFRVCLKVQEKSDSNEMIKTPDAAFLKQAGRFYLQVGYNELFALGQSAWCGAQYYPTEKIKKKIDQSVMIIDDVSNIIAQNDDLVETQVKSSGEELNNVLSYIIEVCNEKSLKANKLWLEKILPNIFVDKLAVKYNYHEEPFKLNPIIGELDDPNNQRQDLLTINLTEAGNTSIYGSSGSGKELLLSSMIYSLITNHSPEEISIYIIDFGSGTLGNFKNAPQVGDFILPSEEDKINNIFKLLDEELERRKKLFVNYNGDYQSYIARSDSKLPYILIFINNFDVFQDSFDFEEIINKISRECSKYGIIIIPAINTTGGMRYKLRQNFKSDIALQFNDQDDYSMIVGNTRKLYPTEIYGRGLVKLDTVYEFQTAHIFNDEEYADELEKVIAELNKKYSIRAPKIPVVPDKVLINNVIPALRDLSRVPVGINKDSIGTEVYNFKDNFATVLADMDDSPSKDDFTRSITKVMSRISNNNLLLLDIDNKLSSEYTNVSYVSNGFDEVLNKICDSIEYQYNTYVENNYNKDALKNTNSTAVIINGFTNLLSRINADVKKRYLDDLIKAKDTGNFAFVLVDRVDNLKKLEYDDWYKKVIQNNNGIWIGNGIADQTLLKTNIGFKKTNNEIPPGFGIVVKNTKTSLVKLVNDGIVTNSEVDEEL